MNRSRRLTPGEVRIDGDSKKIRGVASVFYNGKPETEYRLWTNTVERVLPSAFDRVIEEAAPVERLLIEPVAGEPVGQPHPPADDESLGQIDVDQFSADIRRGDQQ